MSAVRVTDIAHSLVSKRLRMGEVAVDATAGNGYDTLALARMVGQKGEVFALDIQSCALVATGRRLKEHGLDQVGNLHQCGHENLADVVPDIHHGKVSAVMFNLGYLPGGDKSLMTHEQTTLSAIQQALDILKKGGVCTVVCYPGHEGGAREAAMVSQFVEGLDPDLYRFQRHESKHCKNDSPFLWAVEKICSG